MGLSIWKMVRNPPAVQETQVRSLGREEPPEEQMAAHASILAWRTPGIPGGAWQPAVMGSQRVMHNRSKLAAYRKYVHFREVLWKFDCPCLVEVKDGLFYRLRENARKR